MGILIFLILFFISHFGGAFGHSGFDARLNSIVSPYVFSLGGWEVRNLPTELEPPFLLRADINDVSPVIDYFGVIKEARGLEQSLQAAKAGNSSDAGAIQAELNRDLARESSLEGTVETIIEKQIRQVLTEEGVYNPLVDVKVAFPPVRFKLSKPPDLLVVSPRDRIEYLKGIMLRPDLSDGQINNIESRVDGLNVSSLVVGIGGLGATVPTFVADDESLQDAINTAAHEWTHQYLAFRPLGFRYVLDLVGIDRNPDIVSLNETLADMIGREIGSLVYEKYYAASVPAIGGQRSGENPGPAQPVFDFNAEMREISKTVDQYLSQGEVSEAEKYMSERRDFLESKGYYIRKLNQAYFAFYGSYTDSPTSIDPIGAQMRQLRGESPSIKAFLDKASSLTSREELKKAAGP